MIEIFLQNIDFLLSLDQNETQFIDISGYFYKVFFGMEQEGTSRKALNGLKLRLMTSK